MAQQKSLLVRTKPKPSRAEILALYDQGLGTLEVATRLEICQSWARRVKQERREYGVACNATTRRRQPKWAPLVPQIHAALTRQPDLTLDELKVELGTTLHPGTLCRALRKLKLTFQKKCCRRRSRIGRMSLNDVRRGWCNKRVSIRKSCYFSMNSERKRISRGRMGVLSQGRDWWPRCRTVTGNRPRLSA